MYGSDYSGQGLEKITETTFHGMLSQAVEIFQEKMGITLTAGEKIISVGEQFSILMLYGILAIGIAVILNNRRKLKDRTVGGCRV